MGTPKMHNRSSMILRSPQERKQVLIQARTRAQTLQENVNKDTIRILQDVIEESDNIIGETSLDEKLNNQAEVRLDAEIMNESSKVLNHCTRALKKNMNTFNYRDFANKIKAYVQRTSNMHNDDLSWSSLDTEVTKCFKILPDYITLLGTLTPLEKVTVVRKPRSVAEPLAVTRRPENVVATDREEENVEQTVTKVAKIISQYYKKHSKPVNFFQLILHPTDFDKSVENMLYVSFLVRDGRVKIFKDEDGVLVIQPCSKEVTARGNMSGKSANIQNVMTLSMHEWKTLKDAYRLKEPMIRLN